MKPKIKNFKCPKPDFPQEVSSRLKMNPIWNQERVESTCVAQIGVGGEGYQVVGGMARQGVGQIHMFDPDISDPTTLSRAFDKRSLYKPKTFEAGRIFSKQTYLGTEFYAYRSTFQDASDLLKEIKPDIVVCTVDNQFFGTRRTVSAWCHQQEIPLVTSAISIQSNWGYSFIQLPGAACWNCIFQDMEQTKVASCQETPASLDILMVLGGIVLYMVNSFILQREQCWNYKTFSFDKELNNTSIIEKNLECRVCGKES